MLKSVAVPAVLAGMILVLLPVGPAAQQVQPPASRMAPKPQAPPAQPQGPTAPPVKPAEAARPPQEPVPTEATLGLSVYPGAQFIASYDAGRGQRYYLFGSAAPFTDLVTYYRSTLKQKGEMVFEVPATYMFEVGKFKEDTMAFPPGVTLKDYQSDISQGYPNPKPGVQPTHFRSVIQIVPAPPASRQ